MTNGAQHAVKVNATATVGELRHAIADHFGGSHASVVIIEGGSYGARVCSNDSMAVHEIKGPITIQPLLVGGAPRTMDAYFKRLPASPATPASKISWEAKRKDKHGDEYVSTQEAAPGDTLVWHEVDAEVYLVGPGPRAGLLIVRFESGDLMDVSSETCTYRASAVKV